MTELAKAQLIELDADFKNEKPGGQKVSVQFNPETLKVTFANEIGKNGIEGLTRVLSEKNRRPAAAAAKSARAARS